MKKYDFYLVRGLVRETGHWGPFLNNLSEQPYVNSVQGIDLQGNGKFHKISSATSVAEMAHFLHSQIEIKSDKPKIILAVSLGAMVTIELLAHYSSFYHSAFLINTSVAGLSPIYERLKLNSLKHFYEVLIAPSIEERELNILEMVSNSQASIHKIHQLWVDIAKERPVSNLNASRQLLAASYYRLPKQKPQCPIYVMASTADRMVNSVCTEKLAKKWDLPMALHSKAGHELSLDAPEWVLEHLSGWIQSTS